MRIGIEAKTEQHYDSFVNVIKYKNRCVDFKTIIQFNVLTKKR